MKDRLLKIADFLEVSVRSFEGACGLQRGNISNMTDESAIGSDKLAKIIDSFPYLNAEWILTGNGDMIKDSVDKSSLKKGEAFRYKLPTDSRGGIPLISVDAVAGFGKGEFQVMEYGCERYVVPMFKGAEFLVHVTGSSMYPKYSSGDVVACKRIPLNDIFFQWNKVYVLDTDQGPIIKRIKQGTDNDHILIVSENPNYEPFELHKRQIHGVALVIGVIRLE